MGNPDVVLTEQFLERVNLTDLFLCKVALSKSTNSTATLFGVTIGLGGEGESMSYMNNVHVVVPGEKRVTQKVLCSIPSGTLQYGAEGKTLVDNTKVMKTKTFLTFGHVNRERIMHQVTNPKAEDIDQRLHYKRDSQMGNMIVKNKEHFVAHFKGKIARDELSKEDAEVEGRGIDYTDSDIRIGPLTLSYAIREFETKVKSLITGNHNFGPNGHPALYFHLNPLQAHKLTKDYHNSVSVSLEFTYCFNKGSQDMVFKKDQRIVKPMTTPKEKFTETMNNNPVHASVPVTARSSAKATNGVPALVKPPKQ